MVRPKKHYITDVYRIECVPRRLQWSCNFKRPQQPPVNIDFIDSFSFQGFEFVNLSHRRVSASIPRTENGICTISRLEHFGEGRKLTCRIEEMFPEY